MHIAKIIGIILIVAGAAGLAYGQFTYTKETHEADVGPLKFEVKDQETVTIPTWASLGVLGIGVVLLAFPFRKP
jgi:hypothetical protein